MGGGDLNMKKSWHPLLIKNQERVWLEEKKALEERKKLDQLRKEKEEERQLQELQRMQEEQTGRKRAEKLEWMYTTPATGSATNQNDLEDYLLGKKRVDKILTADENAKVGAAHKNFIAVQNANTIRDIAAKIREDPLLAIKQQEQAAYTALMSNPLRLKEMQMRNGVKPKEEKKKKKKEKKEDKHSKQKHHDREEHSRHRARSPSLDRHSRSPEGRLRSRSPAPRSRYVKYERSRSRSMDARRQPRSGSVDDDRYTRRRNGSPRYDDYDHNHDSRGRRDVRRPSPRMPMSDETSSEERKRSRSRSMDRSRLASFGDRKRERSRTSPVMNKRVRPSSPPRRRPTNPTTGYSDAAEDRAARLTAMSSNANSLTTDRKERMIELLEKEKREKEAEEEYRAKNKGYTGFLSEQQKRVFGGAGGLEERIRRGRSGMVVDAD